MLLLGKGGRTVYLGASADALGYFTRIGFGRLVQRWLGLVRGWLGLVQRWMGLVQGWVGLVQGWMGLVQGWMGLVQME